MTNFSKEFLDESIKIISELPIDAIENMASDLSKLKGRLFILGVGGSAGHASHAVNDFRKICGIEAYSPTDNVSELTARTNDEGWTTVFVEWLKISKINKDDALFILSVGGGNKDKNISTNLISAIDLAKTVNAKIYGIIGRDGGYTGSNADICVIIPPLFSDRITPHTEGIAAIIWHLLVSHPNLKKKITMWESQK